MFRMAKTLDVITLFHKSSLQPSMRALAILKQCSAQASETATEDQASDHSHQNKMQRSEFELDVQEAPPTADQVSNVREYLDKEYKDNKKALERIKRDISSPDAVQKFKQDPDSFPRPVIVDWNAGRAVLGDNESEILKLVNQQPPEWK